MDINKQVFQNKLTILEDGLSQYIHQYPQSVAQIFRNHIYVCMTAIIVAIIPHTTKNLFPHPLPLYPSITYHLSLFTQKVIYGDFMVIGEGMEERKWWTGGGWR